MDTKSTQKFQPPKKGRPDNRDRLTSKAPNAGTLNYTYDAHGNELAIASSNADGASMTYSYDALNRLASATDNPN